MADLPANQRASNHGNLGSAAGRVEANRVAMVAIVANYGTSAYLEILLGRLGGGPAGKGHESHGRGRLAVLTGHF